MPEYRNHSIVDAFRCAVRGVMRTFAGQRNLRVQVGIGALVVLLGLLLGLGATEWAILALCISGVLVAELVNTAVEATVDLVSPHYSELARVAKDAAAGAALVAAASSVVVGLLIFIPRLLRLAGRL